MNYYSEINLILNNIKEGELTTIEPRNRYYKGDFSHNISFTNIKLTNNKYYYIEFDNLFEFQEILSYLQYLSKKIENIKFINKYSYMHLSNKGFDDLLDEIKYIETLKNRYEIARKKIELIEAQFGSIKSIKKIINKFRDLEKTAHQEITGFEYYTLKDVASGLYRGKSINTNYQCLSKPARNLVKSYYIAKRVKEKIKKCKI